MLYLFELKFEGCNNATHVGINHVRAIRVNGGLFQCVYIVASSTIPAGSVRIWYGQPILPPSAFRLEAVGSWFS